MKLIDGNELYLKLFQKHGYDNNEITVCWLNLVASEIDNCKDYTDEYLRSKND